MSENLTNMWFVEELEFGVTPDDPAFRRLPFVRHDVEFRREWRASEEMGRAIREQVPVGRLVRGGVDVYTDVRVLDEWIAAVMMGAWVQNEEVFFGRIENGAFIVNKSMGEPSEDLLGAALIEVGNSSVDANNGTKRLVSYDPESGELVWDPPPDDEPNAIIGIRYKYVRNGNTRRTWTIEEEWPRLNQRVRYVGAELAAWEIRLRAGQPVEMRFEIMGRDVVLNPDNSTSTYEVAGGGVLTSAEVDVLKDGVVVGRVVEARLRFEQGLRPRWCLGDERSARYGLGRVEPNGRIRVYFSGVQDMADAVDGRTVDMLVRLRGGEGAEASLRFPALYILNGWPRSGSRDEDVIVEWEVAACVHPALGYVAQYDRAVGEYQPVVINPDACAPFGVPATIAAPMTDGTPCVPSAANVKGTTFECYPEGSYKPPLRFMLAAGRGIDQIHIGDAAFNIPRGTTFECLPEGPLLLMAAGDGIVGVYASDGAFNQWRIMDFETSPTGTYQPGPVNQPGYDQTYAS